MEEDLNVQLLGIRIRKVACLEEIRPDEWKTMKFDVILLPLCEAVY